MAANTLGRNIEFQILNADGTPFHDLVMHKATVETSVMSLGDKITGDVYYANNSLQVTMQEYIVYNNVHYILVNPPTIIREGMVVDNGDLRGMTKYSFEFYHPMYVLGNFPFSDVAVSQDEKRYLSENKSFSWIGKPQDFIDKINKNLEGTEWIVVKSENFPEDTEDELSDVLTFDNNTIADALKIGYETWGLPYIVDQIREDEQGFSSEKKFKVIFGLPSNVIKNGRDEYVFRMGQGVGLKNNSRTPRNNKIVTRIAGYGSENNIPYGYPQIQWYGESNAKFTYGDHAGVYDSVTIGGRTFAKFVSYPIYDGIVGGQNVKLIKHPFTRNHLMPSVYRQELFNKVSPYLSDGSTNSYYDPDIELVDYYDANTDSYPNQINLSSPSYEIHAFEDIKPELGEAEIVAVQPIKNDGTDADGWDDTMDDDGNYLQSYFKLTLPQLDFDLYACAAITEEMQINMRGGACIGCTFPVQVDWDDYKKNFYDDQGKFAPNGAQRNLTKYPKSNSGRITLILQKDNNTFGTLMPNIYQQPKGETTSGANDGDEFVVLGISLPDTYVTNAEGRLDSEMQAYMLANNIYYYDYPLKFDEYFLATHTNILSQIRTNTQVKFQFANEDPMTLFVKQIVIKYGDNVLPQYDITLTDSVEVVLNQIGKVADDVEKLSALVSVLRQSYNRNVWGEIAKKLSKTSNDTAQGEITFVQGLKIGSNGNNGISPNGDATLNDVNVSGDLTITHVETQQGGEPVVKEYGITNDGDISGEGLKIGNYAEGLLGTGGLFKMINGKSYLEADNLYVRMKAYFDTLEIRRYLHSGGNRVASAAGVKLSDVAGFVWQTILGVKTARLARDGETADFYRCLFRASDGDNEITNDFEVGDLAYCHTTNLAGSGQDTELNQKHYWRLVIGKGSIMTDGVATEHYIDLSNAGSEGVTIDGQSVTVAGYMTGSDEPSAEDDVVQLGSANNKTRRGAIVEAVSGAGCAPTYRIYQGLGADSSNLYTFTSPKVDMGYDLGTSKAYLNVFGDFYVGDENESTCIKYEQAHNFGTNANPVYNPLLTIKARIEAASTIGNTSIDQYVGTATQTLIDGKNAVYTITNAAMTQSSGPDYKAGDIWILPNAIGNYPAGTILVANSDRTIDGVNSHNINKWDKKDSYTDDSAFNGYISRLTNGTLINNPSDAQAITNILNVLKGSLESQTTIDGGLVLTSLIAMRNSDDNVTAGLCGDDQDNEIAAWFGGIQKDYEKLTDAQKSQGWNVQKWAKSLIRFDGSGYLAGGDISWTDEGDTTVKGTIKADNFFHNVCFYREGGTYLMGDGVTVWYYCEAINPDQEAEYNEAWTHFEAGKYYTEEEIRSTFPNRSFPNNGFVVCTGLADVVICMSESATGGWAHGLAVTLPRAADFPGKVINVLFPKYGDDDSNLQDNHYIYSVDADGMATIAYVDDEGHVKFGGGIGRYISVPKGVHRFVSQCNWQNQYKWVLIGSTTQSDVDVTYNIDYNGYVLGELLDTLNSYSLPSSEGYLHWTGQLFEWATPSGGSGGGGGTVTSVGLSVPTGFTVSGSPITDHGTIQIGIASGYALATDAEKVAWNGAANVAHSHQNGTVLNGITSTLVGQWNAAYGWGDHSQAGYALSSALAGYLPLTGGSSHPLTGNLTINGAGISINAQNENDEWEAVFEIDYTGQCWAGAQIMMLEDGSYNNVATYEGIAALGYVTDNDLSGVCVTIGGDETITGEKTFAEQVYMTGQNGITFDVDSFIYANSDGELVLHNDEVIVLDGEVSIDSHLTVGGDVTAMGTIMASEFITDNLDTVLDTGNFFTEIDLSNYANVIESVKVNGTALSVNNKAVDVLLPFHYLRNVLDGSEQDEVNGTVERLIMPLTVTTIPNTNKKQAQLNLSGYVTTQALADYTVKSISKQLAQSQTITNGDYLIYDIEQSNGVVTFKYGALSIYWDDIFSKPQTFTPSAHTHAASDITGTLKAGGLDVTAMGNDPSLADSAAGTFAFSANNLLAANDGFDYAGLQVGYSADKWQLTALDGHLYVRENDTTNSTSASDWTAWRQVLDEGNLSTLLGDYVTERDMQLYCADFVNSSNAVGANSVLAGPTSGSASSPTFRSLVAADIPALNYLPLGGGTMVGNISMGVNSVNFSGGNNGGSIYYSSSLGGLFIGGNQVAIYSDGDVEMGGVAIKFGVRPQVHTGTNNGTAVYTNVALTSDIPSFKSAVLSVYNSGGVADIDSNRDLNSFTASGTYCCQSGTIAATLSNTPYTGGNFRLYVAVNTGSDGGSGNWWGWQMLVPGTLANAVYMRTHSGSTWSAWRRLWNFAVKNTKNGNAVVSDITEFYLPLTVGNDGQVELNLSGYATTNAMNTALGGYLPLTAGVGNPLTGNIAYAGTKATCEIIKFIDNTADTSGNGIVIGGGGATIIGGGESSSTMLEGVTIGSDNNPYGGNERMYIGNDNDVHIFTNLGSGWASRKEFLFTSGGGLDFPVRTDGRRLRITSNGALNFNVPTTSAGWASAFRAIRQDTNNTTLGGWGFYGYVDSNDVQQLNYLYAGIEYNNTWMKISADGCVGIGIAGTTVPSASYKLDVNGDIHASASIHLDNDSYIISKDENATERSVFGLASSLLVGYGSALAGYNTNIDGANIIFNTRATSSSSSLTERMRILANGNVGIGVNNPSEKLEVSGNVKIAGGADFTGTVAVGSNGMITIANAAKISFSAGYLGFTKVGSSAIQYSFDGNVYATAFNPSDINRKDVTRFLEPSVRDIANAPIIEFAWRDDASKEAQLGTIAQYWEKVLPQAVKTAPDGSLALNYDAVAVAAAVTTARKAVDNERRIAELEMKVAELEDLLAAMDETDG